MTATGHKDWLAFFDNRYEFYCDNGEYGEEAAQYACEDADEIYNEKENMQ